MNDQVIETLAKRLYGNWYSAKRIDPVAWEEAGVEMRDTFSNDARDVLAAIQPFLVQPSEDGRELTLRLADAYVAVHDALPRDEDGDVDQDSLEHLEGQLPGGFFTVLDFALTGGQGCLDDDEFAEKRNAALAKHRAALNLPASPQPEDRGGEEERFKELRADVEMRVRELLEEAGLASPPPKVSGEHGEESWWRQGRDDTLEHVRGDLADFVAQAFRELGEGASK